MPNIINDIKLDFKDVLLRPKRSTLKSRSDVSNIYIKFIKIHSLYFCFISFFIKFSYVSYIINIK